MSFTVSSDVSKISYNQTATFYVESDELIYAYEARAYPYGDSPERGEGINLLYDEGGYDVNGVHTLETPVYEFQFDVSGSELSEEGKYLIYVHLQTADGWMDPIDVYGGPGIGSGDPMEEEEGEL